MPDGSDLRGRVRGLLPELSRTLADLVRVPSVSAPGAPAGPIRESAERVADLLRAAGLTDARLLEVEGAHPAVYGSLPGPDDAPTVLLYAHHDVQPGGPVEEWERAPFEPFERDGRLYGRGSSDDKAGIVMHLGAIRAFEGRPPVGVKVLVEGEEEVGSSHLGELLDRHAHLLEADVVVVGDSSNWRVGQPGLTVSLRGLVSCLVEVRTAGKAVHSGQFGGVFPDAITVLCRLLATLHDEDGTVAVPGLVSYDSDPLDLTEDEVAEQMATVPGLQALGRGAVTSRLWSKPSISILAIDAPRVGEAINQLVPSARAKVSMRIAPGQDPDEAMNALRRHLIEQAPWGAEVTVVSVEKGAAFRLARSGPAFEAWREAMREAWGREPVEMGVGGSIPFVAALSERYPDAAILLVGPGDPTSAFHAPNESQHLGDLERSILAEALALRRLAG